MDNKEKPPKWTDVAYLPHQLISSSGANSMKFVIDSYLTNDIPLEKAWYSVQLELISNYAVVDLGGKGEVMAASFKKNFSIFPRKPERKNKFTLLRMASKRDFHLKSPTP